MNKQKHLDDYQAAIDGYVNGEPARYNAAGQLVPIALGDSALGSVETDPAYREMEMAALRELETQSKEGLTARDRADMAAVDKQTNRAHRGRQGAIEQQMLARGMQGSGMDLVAQMQSSQDANEIAALRSLEKEGMIQDRKREGTRNLGAMASNLQDRDYRQAADRARAKDLREQFNADNRMQVNAQNLSASQALSNLNTGTANDFAQNSMSAKLQGSQMGYNAAAEAENRRLLEEQEREKKRKAKEKAIGAGIGGALGGVAGGVFGGPAGAAVGYSAGSALGGGAGEFLSDENVKKGIKPEDGANIEAFLASLNPKSFKLEGEDKLRHGVIAGDLERTAIGKDMLRKGDDGVRRVDVGDAVSALFQAVAHLNRKVSK